MAVGEDNMDLDTAPNGPKEADSTATDSTSNRTAVTENGITIKQPDNKKAPGKHNPKLSIFREVALATAHAYAKDHVQRQLAMVPSDDAENGRRQYFACDLITQSGIAGLQWKRHIGEDIHVTAVEQRDSKQLQDNIKSNGITSSTLPQDPKRPAGMMLPQQGPSQIHLAECDPSALMLLEAFDFVYVDPHKNPSPYFSTLFRNVRNNGVVCIVVPDTMQFARSPHVVRRYFGANCIKTGYMKELAVRIILAALATEAARCNKGMTVLYSITMEDFLLLCVRMVRGPKLADATLQNIGHVLHCRICEERVFYPEVIAPIEDPYSLIQCDCQKNIPGKTGVVLGPLWKGRIFEYPCLTKLAASGKALNLTHAFFVLLQRVMEDCVCDTPPSLVSLKQGLSEELALVVNSTNGESSKTEEDKGLRSGENDFSVKKKSLQEGSKDNDCAVSSKIGDGDVSQRESQLPDASETTVSDSGDIASVDADCAENGGVKRSAPESEVDISPRKLKRLKSINEPAPCFFYNVHSKRLGKEHLPKQQAIIERLRAHGYRCCRTHFEKYAIRTSANLKTLTALLGTGESKVLYVKGNQAETLTAR
ncbi:TRMT1-like protein [Littorina saxatilis]|uniref:tRNA (guanine(26)-N(2))-dimethyltransferase n=1 Tax=Littorina saxatilis TaxID=31220 RepID=A0AAN9G528_9CAEN